MNGSINHLPTHILTIPNKSIMQNAATIDNPAPDNDASVKSLGIFLHIRKKGKICLHNNKMT